MGRELRRKEAKKNGKSLKKEEVRTFNEWQKPVLIMGIVIIILVILYLILAIFVTKEIDFSKKDKNDTYNGIDEASSVANPILASTTFKQSDDVYYVYFFNFKDSDTNVGNTISNNLLNEKVYRVNTNDDMNSKYIAEKGNKDSSNIDNLKVSDPTLIKIEHGQVTLYLEGSSEIIGYYN